jgi:hypothetical protein
MEMLFFYLLFAFACACLYTYLHGCIGAPRIDDTGLAKVESRGMIFSDLGAWICDKYNAYQATQYKAFGELARAELEQMKRADGVLYAHALEQAKTSLQSAGVPLDAINDEMLQAHAINETAAYTAQNAIIKNPYKAMGICDICTAFWFFLPLYIGAMMLQIWALPEYHLGLSLRILGGFMFVPLGYFSLLLIQRIK